jgi:hypothetical protein
MVEETAAPEIAIAVPRSRAISFFIFSFSFRFVPVPRAKAAAASFLIRCVPVARCAAPYVLRRKDEEVGVASSLICVLGRFDIQGRVDDRVGGSI